MLDAVTIAAIMFVLDIQSIIVQVPVPATTATLEKLEPASVPLHSMFESATCLALPTATAVGE